MLNFYQGRTHRFRHVFAQQNADMAVEFVNLAHGVNAQAVFRNPGVVAQAGGAAISGAGGDLCKTISHSADF